MRFLILTSIATLLIAGCATPLPEEKARPFQVEQVGAQKDAQLVFCHEGKCPLRTRKFLPLEPVAAEKGKKTDLVPAVRLTEHHFKVHFPWGKSSLDKSGKKELLTVTSSDAFKNAASILVEGRTDPSGSLKFNEKLAVRRANTVKTALASAGASIEAIYAIAKEPCCDGDKNAAPSVMQELRRTDIDITIKAK